MRIVAHGLPEDEKFLRGRGAAWLVSRGEELTEAVRRFVQHRGPLRGRQSVAAMALAGCHLDDEPWWHDPAPELRRARGAER